MCIICVKNKGVAMPSLQVVKNMFNNNSDGAGYMYLDAEKQVVIRKGFMDVQSFIDSITDLDRDKTLTNTDVVFHFRIGTAGGNTQSNTHPFPLTDSIKAMKKLRLKCSVGIAHNGIIPIKTSSSTISDTMEYIASVVHPTNKLCYSFWKNNIGQKLIIDYTGSKFAILESTGVTLVGDFITDELTGLHYSNSTYKYSGYYLTANSKRWSGAWDDYDAQDDFRYSSTTNGVKKIYAMELSEDDYIQLSDNSYITCDDGLYHMSSVGNVYLYNIDTDMLEYVGGTAYKPTGEKEIFSYIKAETLDCKVLQPEWKKAGGTDV